MPNESAVQHLHREPTLETIATASRLEADACDREGCFPAAAFDALGRLGLLHFPGRGTRSVQLLRVLAAVGKGDLSVGRIYEGHVNALDLLERFGTANQRKRISELVCAGGLLGVWNTDQPGYGVVLDGMSLRGSKAFASGVDGLSHAVITAGSGSERQMLLIPTAGLRIDRTWWRPLGMRASGSHLVDFTGVEVSAEWPLGCEGDYIREPWFSTGAMRFAAVHVGGMHAIFDIALEHLRRTGRLANPYQSHRIARMGMLVEAGYAWLDRASQFLDDRGFLSGLPAAVKRAIPQANAARLSIERLALALLEQAERCVGAAGFIAPHPLERVMRDLRTYLRQPNPDGALTNLGSAIESGTWSPGHDFAVGGSG